MGDKRRHKIWRASPSSQTAFSLSEGSAKMVGSSDSFLAVDKDGISLSSKSVSFVTGSESMRRSGLWVELNDFVRMIPTTIATPMPSQIPFPPMGIITSLTAALPVILAAMAYNEIKD